MRQHLQMEVGYSHSGHIVTGWWLLSCMPVELLGRGASSLIILEREGKCWSVFPPPQLRPVTFHGPVSLEVIFGLSLLHPGLAVACSPHLHGSRYIRGGPLRGTSLYAGCTGAGCRGLSFLLGGLAGLTGCDLRPLGSSIPTKWGHLCSCPFLATTPW